MKLLTFLTVFFLHTPLILSASTPVNSTVTSSCGSACSTGASSKFTSNASPTTHVSSSGLSSTPTQTSVKPSLSATSSTPNGNSTLSTSQSSAPATNGTTTSTTTSSAPQPTPTVDPNTLNDIRIMQVRRLSNIVGALNNASTIDAWVASLGPDGKWPDNEVDYTTGCDARRANWPAQDHWQRLLVMAAAWHGGLPGGEQYVKNADLLRDISLAMDYWFGRDITNLACLDSGGTASCPCSNPDNTLWNTNWFSNIILIPELVGETCLLLNDTLTSSQFDHCTAITGRSYALFDHNIHGVGFLTGANTLDVAKIGIDNALLTLNATLISDAYRRVHEELVIHQEVKADGIRPDGSFGQHSGVLYNGNYGKDFANDILDLEVEAAQTQFAANTESQSAFAALFDGNRWMIYQNVLTGTLHWDFSVLGRFISFPVIDNQATGSIKMNLTEIGELGRLWSSPTLIDFAEDLSKGDNNANAGKLQGNRMFYANDYMVHRGRNYVSTVKMYSTRTKNTECVNTQNPLGFHLSDGAQYTYLQGNEYEDISAAWDWNLVPGTTVDYEATPLSCDDASVTGVEDFVGGVSNGDSGIAVMRYTNPLTHALQWQKVWFFLEDDVQHVMISNVTSTSSAPIYSVLDQRRHNGDILIDDGLNLQASDSPADATTLWHGNVGYALSGLGEGDTLHVDIGERTGPWSAIGTSTQPPATVDLFAARIEHGSAGGPLSYSVFSGTDFHSFKNKNNQLRLQSISNDGCTAAVFDETHKSAMVVFWEEDGGSVTFTPPKFAPITITSNGNIALLYRMDDNAIVISDPSQQLSEVEVNISLGPGRKPAAWGSGREKNFVIPLPQAGLAGGSVRQDF